MTLAELRVVRHRPARSVMVAPPTKMYLSEDLQPEQIDYLYSELTCFKSIGVWLRAAKSSDATSAMSVGKD
jgi:hypothetical protein